MKLTNNEASGFVKFCKLDSYKLSQPINNAPTPIINTAKKTKTTNIIIFCIYFTLFNLGHVGE